MSLSCPKPYPSCEIKASFRNWPLPTSSIASLWISKTFKTPFNSPILGVLMISVIYFPCWKQWAFYETIDVTRTVLRTFPEACHPWASCSLAWLLESPLVFVLRTAAIFSITHWILCTEFISCDIKGKVTAPSTQSPSCTWRENHTVRFPSERRVKIQPWLLPISVITGCFCILCQFGG